MASGKLYVQTSGRFNKEKEADSKMEALNKIIQYLSAGNVDEQFSKRSGDYYSGEKFIVSWNAMWRGMVMEYSIDKCDQVYASISGYKAIYVRRSLIYEKQLKGYSSIERALIEVGLALCKGRVFKEKFFQQFAKPYNDRLKK